MQGFGYKPFKTSQEFSVLFTGDIEEIAESKIVKIYGDTDILQSTILKVAHHGSKTSSTQEFLNLVKPRIALIGVGQNNKFGHPNEGVVERLNKMNCEVYRTDEMGEITIKVLRDGNIKVDRIL